jgi:hypothetical protein
MHALTLLAVLAVSGSGCATIFSGSPKPVDFQSDPSAADVVVNGQRLGTTPVTLELLPERTYTVTFRKVGYDDVTITLDSHVQAGWVVLDILGGVVPVVIDAATGKWKAFGSSQHFVRLTPAARRADSAPAPPSTPVAGPAVPTDRQSRKGFWASFAPAGVGWNQSEGAGYAVLLRFGGTISQRLLVGAEGIGVLLDYQHSRSIGNVSLIAMLYPLEHGGLFLKPGVGVAATEASCDYEHQVSAGLGATLGIGYDVRIGGNTYLTPNLDLLVRTTEGPCGTGAGPAFAFTVALTWH